MGFVIPMLLAFMLAVAVMTVLAVVVLREGNLAAVFHEETVEHRRR